MAEAKKRFSELIHLAQTEWPQVVTRYGQDVAVIVSIEEFERLGGRRSSQPRSARDSKEFCSPSRRAMTSRSITIRVHCELST